MACVRGCTGTPICSALDLCCIQFRQDCGKGCTGVADGYTVLQFNTAGALEVCSNVGGVCTCEGIATGSDSLVNNGDGTLTHTAQDGTPVDFCNGICSVISDNDCLLGVGVDYAVEEFVLDPVTGILTLNSKAEHEHIVVETPPDFVNTNIPDGTLTGVSVALDNNIIIFNNPSDCRAMEVCIRARNWSTVINYESDPGYQMSHDISTTVDFGAGVLFAHVVSAQNTISNPTVTPAHSNNVGEIEHCFTLAAGGNQNITIATDYNCGTGPCAEADYFGTGWTIRGQTI